LAAYEQPPNIGRRGLGTANAAAIDKLLSYLKEQRQDERYLVAVPSSMMAAPLNIATGLPVIAVGGFAGLDPILTPEKLQRLVEARQLRFVMIGNSRRSARMEAAQSTIGCALTACRSTHCFGDCRKNDRRKTLDRSMAGSGMAPRNCSIWGMPWPQARDD
jgi:hypothetical protein